MRAKDKEGIDFEKLRSEAISPDNSLELEPGYLVVPEQNSAIVAVIASSVMVTLYDVEQERGGACHFVLARPKNGAPATALYGAPACYALINSFLTEQPNKNFPISKPENMRGGIYGGAWPEWANAAQREISRSNIDVAKDIFEKKGIMLLDEDSGGHKPRKMIYFSGTNEVAIFKTEKVRQTDWYPD